MKLYILGAGTAASQLKGIPNRFPPGFLLEWPGGRLLFECSEGIRFRLEKMGFDYAKIEHMAITHCDPDHYCLVPYLQSILCKGIWSDSQKYQDQKLNIYCPNQISDYFPKLFKAYLPHKKGQLWKFPKLKFFPMSGPGKRRKIGKATLTAEKVYHGFGKMECLAFRVKVGKEVFVYSGDTGDCEGIRKIVKGADFFLCECTARIGEKEAPYQYGHLTPRVAGEIAKEGKVKRILFFHNTGLDKDSAVIKDCKSSGFSGQIEVARDFEVKEF